MRFFTQRGFLFFVWLVAGLAPLQAQIPGLPSLPTPPAAAAPVAETIEETDARLQQWLKEARGALVRLSEPGAEKEIPQGIDPAALAEYRRDLEQIVLSVARHQKVLAAMPDARKALEGARTSNAGWSGFAEKPPFSILMIDELVNQQESTKEKAASYQSSQELFGRSLSAIQEEARMAEEASRQLRTAAAEGGADDVAAQWRLEADRTKSRALALRATFFQSSISLLNDQAEAAKNELALLDRKITTARKKAELSEDDLAKVTKAATDRRAALRKEIAATQKRQLEITSTRNRLQASLTQLQKPAADGVELRETPETLLAKAKLDAAESRLESLQFVGETLESLNQLETLFVDSYQTRKHAFEARDLAGRNRAVQSLRSSFDRLQAWSVVVANEQAAINADISGKESRATLLAAEDPLLVPLSDQRAALWEKQAVIQRLSQALSFQRRALKRWLADFDHDKVAKPLMVSVSDAGTSIWSAIKRIWRFEVFHYNDTVMIGGLPITEKRGVTLGKFFIATFFFFIAYLISTRIKNRVQGVVVRRGHIAEAQAKTLSNWLMLIVVLLLAVGTLHFLQIPLTVFAFFGGALAIGLGFGSQTLIKNFISGIIVLFERKIRVGDIVDVGGLAGAITEINTRSSVLRSGDGKETLIPNSFFLENRVTNLTLSNRRVRRVLYVRLEHGASSHQVIGVLKESVERHGLILKDPAPVITLDDFAEKGPVFAIYYWTEFNDKTNADVVASDIRFMIDKRFTELEILLAGAEKEISVRLMEPLKPEPAKP